MDRKNSTLLAVIHAANDAADSVKAEEYGTGASGDDRCRSSQVRRCKIKGVELFKWSYRVAVILMRLYGY